MKENWEYCGVKYHSIELGYSKAVQMNAINGNMQAFSRVLHRTLPSKNQHGMGLYGLEKEGGYVGKNH